MREAASKEQVANEEVVEQMNAAKMAQEMAEKGRESEYGLVAVPRRARCAVCVGTGGARVACAGFPRLKALV